MAGDDVWHGLLLAVNWVTNVWSNWSMQILVLLSLAVQFALTISAAFRWRGARWVRKFIWSMYALGDYLAVAALSKLSVSTTSGVHQLVALWAPIFLLHLGGPDNISAYSLEDNELSKRKMMELILRVLGAAYVTISISGSRKLVVAARWILFVLGFFKYLEKAIALRRANLGNLRKSVMKEPRAKDVKGSNFKYLEKAIALRRANLGNLRKSVKKEPRAKDVKGSNEPELQWDDKLLLEAHSLFHICKRAMVDSSIMLDQKDIEDWEDLICLPEWKDTWKVMEMELSLMYDILYTKAAVIHTWYGYLIRVLSPIATLIVLVLFELSIEAGWSRVDVWITRILLVSTVFLETVSLLSALESSWTVAYFGLCNRRWHRFRHGLVSLRRFVSAEGCREWSGTIGQHNMLRSCKRNRDMKDRPCSLAKKMGVEWCKDEHYYLTEKNAHPSMELVFEALLELLRVVDTLDEGSDSESEHSTIQNTGADSGVAEPRAAAPLSRLARIVGPAQNRRGNTERSWVPQDARPVPKDTSLGAYADPQNVNSPDEGSDSESEHSTIQNTGADSGGARPRRGNTERSWVPQDARPVPAQNRRDNTDEAHMNSLDESSDLESECSSTSESEHSTIQNTGADSGVAEPRAARTLSRLARTIARGPAQNRRGNTERSWVPQDTSLGASTDPRNTERPEAGVNTLGLLKAEKGGRALKKLCKALINQEDTVPLERYIREEIHEGILIWHIATDVYLYHRHRNHAEEEDATTTQHVEAIMVLSNYMMFLLVEHPYMLPGLVLRKLYEVTRDDLAEIWGKCATVSNRAHQDNDLAKIMDEFKNSRFVKRPEGRGLLLAKKLAKELLELEKKPQKQQGVLNPILKLVFDVWVEMLLYASHRSSRESHAKKLSTVRSGAELATVVWLIAEHAALYPVNKDGRKKRKKPSKDAHSKLKPKFSTEEV